MQPHAEIARGETHDGPNGCNMSGSGQILRWLAVRGYVNDWCIYVGRITDDWEGVRAHGDKVLGEINIRRLVPCTDEAFEMYRY
jgi:hypothetical protein